MNKIKQENNDTFMIDFAKRYNEKMGSYLPKTFSPYEEGECQCYLNNK